MRLALTDLFKAHWTDRIHDEWINALLRAKKQSSDSLLRVKELMDRHVRDAKVYGYEPLIEGLDLPDPDDRHVLAAAIRCNANAIVTFNLKDFPDASLRQSDIEVIHPDDFYSLSDRHGTDAMLSCFSGAAVSAEESVT